MRVLILSNLYPNRQQPGKSEFNRQQFSALQAICDVQVVCPIPCFRFSKNDVPLHDNIGGIKVSYPRHLVIPKFFQSLSGPFMFFGLYRHMLRVLKTFKADVIYATWAYPDAFAAALLAKANGLPLVVKTHGTDLNYGLKFRLRRPMIRFAMNCARRIICVSKPLQDKLTELGVDGDKIRVLSNGVDTTLFKPSDRHAAMRQLGLDDRFRHLLFVGNLVPVKGADVLIESLACLPADVHLHVIGFGTQEADLRLQVESLGLTDRIHFHGKQQLSAIPTWQNAVDVFCLPSRNEGCPNVVVEALACGTPTVATNVGAVPELITNDKVGLIVPSNQPGELATAIIRQLEVQPAVREANIELSWSENAQILYSDLQHAVRAYRHPAKPSARTAL